MQGWLRRKDNYVNHEGGELARTLSWWHLVALGVVLWMGRDVQGWKALIEECK